ncbi:thiamine ABC transporter substrate-binding protein [Leucobacter tenebrionis]|uniref:thiamine ABC transporter substrate-binding protein n=1 Tax=Leucobacter tenebrionis TaxID=2873270 RepID=UPI001CA71129|nr:thiamine ABC transporter substrate-binding protein [Leucobacter tenebrionis]QZY52727.1 thiamine ABC transporter substrate-binding protein [Leucobacter tenebrionis]
MVPVSRTSPIARTRRTAIPVIALTVVCALAFTGCSGSESGGGSAEADKVTLVVHDSFPNDEVAEAASAATGYDVEVISAGDGGELTNKLVLTAGAPIADAFFGVDNIFASRLVDNDVVVPYTPSELPKGALEYALGADGSEGDGAGSGSDAALALTPVDTGATCINIDTAWFEEKGLDEPETYEDLADPAYRDLTVLLDPTASSTGASFLVGTVAAFGEDGFADYWKRLTDNGARIEQGWSDAYYGQFTQGGEGGTRPIVVSYASSPAFTVDDELTASTTKALLDTCTRQVEYAGVLRGAANEAGAKAVVDYLVSHEFQQTIPDAMYMSPVDDTVEMPEAWAKFAPEPRADQTHDLTPEEIERGRERWLGTLGDTIGL